MRKGSVAAFVANARRLPGLAEGSAEYAAVVAQLRSLLPALEAVGVLEVFEVSSPVLAGLIASV